VGYLGDMRELFDTIQNCQQPERPQDVDATNNPRVLFLASVGITATAGFIYLGDLDPKAAQLLAEFRSKLREAYGNMLTAWTRAFDPTDRGGVDVERFTKQCSKVGFLGDAALLFTMLRGHHAQNFLTLHDFDIQAYRAHTRDDPGMITEDGHKRLSPFEMSFDERQDSSVRIKWARAQSCASRATLASTHQEEREADVNSDSLATLKAQLIRKHGSLTIAWRESLDPLNVGKLTREDFLKAVRQRVGYSGDMKKLWEEIAKQRVAKGDEADVLMASKQGLAAGSFVTLHDLDPKAAEALWNLRAFLLDKYGNIVSGWREGLDPWNRGRLEEEEFKRRLGELGFEGDVHQLFRHLRGESSRRFITISDLDLGAAQAYYRGDAGAVTVHGTKVGASSPTREWPGRKEVVEEMMGEKPNHTVRDPARHTRATVWSQKLGKTYRSMVEERSEEEKGKQMLNMTLNGFRKMLESRFGTCVAAWRCALDTEGLNRLSFGHFREALNRMGGCEGSVKHLWAEFDTRKEGQVTLQDLDPEAFGLLARFREALLLCHPSGLQEAWHKGLDVGGIEKLSEDVFLDHCKDMALDLEPKDLERSFQLMLPEHRSGRRHLIVDDLHTVLLLGVPLPDRMKAWTGSHCPAETPGRRKQLAEIAKNHRLEIGLDMRAEDFKKLLTRSFGSLYAGWVKYMDITQADRVPMGEFVQRAKAIGAAGNVKELFAAIDTENRGYIMLRDLDPEVSEAVANFHGLIAEKYGSVREAWKKALDPKGIGRVGLEDFERGCTVLGYLGNAKRLFQLLRPENGRPYLYLDDLGHQAKAEFTSPPSSPKGSLKESFKETATSIGPPPRPTSRGNGQRQGRGASKEKGWRSPGSVSASSESTRLPSESRGGSPTRHIEARSVGPTVEAGASMSPT